MAQPRFDPERSSISRGQARSKFVGRQREMAELRSGLDGALSGQGRVVMLAGEPGIGKTRTAQELASYAEEQGAKVLWGWCYEEEGAPPYWPWVQTIRSYVQGWDAGQLRSEMGHGAAHIAEIVSEINSKITDLEPSPALESEAARFRLFDSVTTFLKNASQSQPLMLVLDDLHWADKASLLLLQFLARELAPAQSGRLLVVGCYQDVGLSRHHPLSETLAQISRATGGGGFQRVLLQGLDHDDTARFIQASTGTEPATALVEALFSQTEGNPFFLTEVIRLLSERGELTAQHTGTPEGLRIPEGVREVIGQRLDRLSERCSEVLTTASIIGREFDFRLLRILSVEMSEDQLLQAVDEAVTVHLIEDVPGQRDRYQFSHALIQQTLGEEMTTSRRVRLHARIAEALEELYGNDAEAHAAELAHHFAQAEAVSGRDKLVRYSLLAGERALASYAYEDALVHFERGLTARDINLSGTEAAPDEEAAALLFGLARAQSAIVEGYEIGETFATLNRAFEYYAEVGNVAQAVAVAEFPVALPSYRIPGVAELIARAITLVPADSHEAGRLLSRYGGILGAAENDYEGAQQALGRAIAIARRDGDVSLEVQTLTYAAEVSANHLHWQECVENGLRAIELATGDENVVSALVSPWWTALGLLRMGDLDAARSHASVLRDQAERQSTPRQLASIGFEAITYVSCLEGDWKASRELSGRGLEWSPLNPQLLLTRVLLEYQVGESALGEVYLERLLGATRQTRPDRFWAFARVSMVISAIARITGLPNRLEIAEAAAEAVLSEQALSPATAMYANTGLALLAVQRGDQSAAEDQYADLLTQRGTMVWTVASVDRLLGLLSQTMGNMDQAAAHFEDALVFCLKAGYRPELAWTCCDYADVLTEREGMMDRARAMALLEESLAISTGLGMLPLVARVTERMDRVRVNPPAAQAYPGGLTPREVEVLRLVAVGHTNRVIAHELVIGVRTVSTHVSNILNKTNSTNRTEAASYANRHGLV